MPEPWSSLTHQSLGRPISEDEHRLAQALEKIYVAGIGDFDEVARLLSEQVVVAPAARTTQWTVALLESELSAINSSLDAAYARNGLGA